MKGCVTGALSCRRPKVIVADRSGRRVCRIFLMLRPVRAWASRETARAANTMVRWASTAGHEGCGSAGRGGGHHEPPRLEGRRLELLHATSSCS